MFRLKAIGQLVLMLATLFLFLGAGDDSARFRSLGHRVMCVCGCNYVLLECNHVGCPYSDRMRAELVAAVDREPNDNLVFQKFIDKYGPAVMLAPAKTGFGRIAWITPYGALILGVSVVVLIVWVWSKRAPSRLPTGGVSVAHLDGLDSYRDQVRRDTEI